MKFFRNTKGIISIFLTLVMLPMFTCAGLIIDGSRVSAAKTAASGAGDLAMNAALSEFDEVLHQVYGLFAMSDSVEDLQNNVSRYFYNTINNTGVLQGSDSYTRSFINSIGSLFSDGDISFDNIVDTQADTENGFKLIEIPSSALANPIVLERQIVEYMKYRAPVNMGIGLLTKLGCIGETSKQTKVLEAKVEYEKKLDTVQDACETAYSAINAFNNHAISKGFTSGSGDEPYISRMQTSIDAAEQLTEEMVRYIIASKSPSYSINNMTVDTDLKSSLEGEIRRLSGDNVNLSAYELVKTYLAPYINFTVDSNGNYTAVNTDFQSFINNMGFGTGDTLQQQSDYVLTVKANYSLLRTVYTYLDVLSDRFSKLTEAERGTLNTEYNKYYSYSGSITGICYAAKGLPQEWKSKANQKGHEASQKLYGWYEPIGQLNQMIQDALDAIDVVKQKINELNSARSTWNNRINALNDSEIKTSMRGDYSNTAEKLNEDAVNKVYQILSDDKTHFTALKNKLDSIKLYDKQIYVAGSASINYNSRFSEIPTYDVNAWFDLQDRGDQVMRNYTSATVTTGISPEIYTRVTENDQFYRYLKNVCSTVEGETGDEATAKEQRTELLNHANSDEISSVTIGEGHGGSYVGENGISSEISAAIDSFSNENGGFGGFTRKPISNDDNANDKSRADDAKNNLTNISDLLSSLENIGESIRDSVYLEEYFTEMFSCYTSGRNTSGHEVTPYALNNVSMAENRFYGSEAEYIIWGGDTAEGNVQSTKALIFGIRFALNSIFAFTSSTTRTPALAAATAIAGWTGFGVPIVQTVILLAWGLAESVVDLDMLCKGQPVSLYKSASTWITGPNGLKDAIKEQAISLTGDIFDKLTDTATEAVGNLTESVGKYVETTIDGMSDSIEGSIMTTIQSIALQIIGESNMNLRRDDIEIRIDAAISSIGDGTKTDAVSIATRTAATGIRNLYFTSGEHDGKNVREYIIDTIYEQYENMKSGITSGITAKVEEMLSTITEPIKTKVKDALNSLRDTIQTELTTIIQNGGDQVKEKLASAIDDYMGTISGTESGTTSLATGFTMTYKEYVKTFVLMELTMNRTTMLKRCAKLIQVNVAKRKPSFNIAEAYTMVEANAKVSVKTTFFNVPVATGVDSEGNTTYELDFSRIGSDRIDIDYVGVLSY